MNPTNVQLFQRLIETINDSSIRLSNALQSSTPFEIYGYIITLITAFLGAIVGVWLTNHLQDKKENRKIKRLKSVMIEELKFIKEQLDHKKRSIDKLLDWIQKDTYYDVTSIKFIDIGYNKYIIDLYLELSPKQRNALHYIYESLKRIDELLLSIEDKFAKRSNNPDFYIDKVKIIENLGYLIFMSDQVKQIVESYLENKINDGFNIKEYDHTK